MDLTTAGMMGLLWGIGVALLLPPRQAAGVGVIGVTLYAAVLNGVKYLCIVCGG